MKTTKKIFGTALVLALTMAATLQAQNLYVVNAENTIGEYSALGATVNSKLITTNGLYDFIAISGNELFVANDGNGAAGDIAEYTLSGQAVNASLISGLNDPIEGIAISGTNVFVVNGVSGTIGEYSTSGQTINASLISGLNIPCGIAISGTNLFVVNSGNGTIGEYSISGQIVNASLITGLNRPYGIAVSGNDLFVGNDAPGNGYIAEYTTSGATVNASLITGLFTPTGIAVSGADIYVASGNTAVSEYRLDGSTVNSLLISGLPNAQGIAIASPPQLDITPAGNQSVLFYPYPGPAPLTGYILQSTTNLASTNWVTVTNGAPVIAVVVTNNLPSSFFRLVPAP